MPLVVEDNGIAIDNPRDDLTPRGASHQQADED
jgi:hypothetical protein